MTALIKTRDGDLTVTVGGVRYRPWRTHGDVAGTAWSWEEIRRLTARDIGRKTDLTNIAVAGIFGLLVRPKRVAITLSTIDEDLIMETTESFDQVRALLRRVADDEPSVAPKIEC